MTVEQDKNPYVKRKLIFLVLAFCVLISGGLIVAQLYTRISADNFLIVKNVIQDKLDKLGYALHYETIEINPSLVPSIRLQKVIFRNKNDAKEENLFEAKELLVNFEILPLLMRKDFVVDNLDVNDAKIYVLRDKAGNNNWFRSAQNSSSSQKPHISLGQSKFKNVELHYSGPTFSNKKIILKEALIAYSHKGVLAIEKAEGQFNDYKFSLKGDVDSVDSFMKSEGAHLDIDFELDELLSLQLVGDIGSTIYPTENGIKLNAKGENIALFIRKIFPDIFIPDVDNFGLRGNLYSNGGGALKLDVADALVRRKSHSVRFKGNVAKRDKLELDLYVASVGDNLYQLTEGF